MMWVLRWARQRSYKKAVKEANRQRAASFKKMHVIFWKGEFIAISSQKLKLMHKSGYFKRGTSVKDLSRIIYYTT